MILKIERYNNHDWWMVDDIRRVSKQHFEQDFSADFEASQGDVFILDYSSYVSSKNIEKKSRKVIKITYRISNGSEFSILFDTIAYLLNDEGKTIEKIVANYKD